MNKDLEAIRKEVEKPKEERDMDKARKAADAYVAAHPELFTELEQQSLEQCVTAVGVFRAAGMDESQWRVEAWLLHQFEPQNIGGPVVARVRLPNG